MLQRSIGGGAAIHKAFRPSHPDVTAAARGAPRAAPNAGAALDAAAAGRPLFAQTERAGAPPGREETRTAMTDLAASLDVSLLHGCWELVSWTRTDAAGALSYPFSESARGRIIYHPSGLMSAFLMNPSWATEPDAPGHRFLSYSGRYVLKGDVVEHAVDLASDPKFVGIILRRRVAPEGGLVVLETLAAVGRTEREGSHRLVWRPAD